MVDEEAQAPDEEQQPPKKKSKVLLFIVLGIGILLLGGGGYFAYTKFLTPKPAAEEMGAEEKAPQPLMGEIFALEPFVVNLADPKGKRYLKIKIELELESPEAVAQAEKVAPKLRDMVIMMLTSLTFEDVMTPEGKIRIRDELFERFNQIMRPQRIKNIYFTEFVVQ